MLRRMFELRLAGQSLDAIGQAVADDALRPALGRRPRRLSVADVERILKHEFDAGWFDVARRALPRKHEPVLSADEWARRSSMFTRSVYGSPA